MPPHNEHWNPVWTYLGEQVRRFDTLEIALAAAHRHDLRLIYALCPADFVESPFAASAFHPDLWLQSRRGEPFHGVPCLAEPEAQSLLLEHLVAVLDCGVDDLAISCFSHMAGQGVNQRDYYGFNPAPLQAYREQRAIDPLHHGIDADLWHTLHGDFYTAFLGRVHAETSKRGQRLIPFTTRAGNWGWGGEGGAQLVAHYLQGQAVPTAVPAFALELQWQRWARMGLADALLVLNPVADAAIVRQEAGVPVILWRHTGPLSTDAQWDQCSADARQIATGVLDGFAAHAMFLVEHDGYLDKLWSLMHAADR